MKIRHKYLACEHQQVRDGAIHEFGERSYYLDPAGGVLKLYPISDWEPVPLPMPPFFSDGIALNAERWEDVTKDVLVEDNSQTLVIRQGNVMVRLAKAFYGVRFVTESLMLEGRKLRLLRIDQRII